MERKEQSPEATRLFEQNINLAYWWVNKKRSSYTYDDDMIQSALIGLWKASMTFDTEKGIRFATYAVRCIHNEILQAERRKFHSRSVTACSLNELIGDEDGPSYELFLPDEKADGEFSRILVDEFLSSLSTREREIVILRVQGLEQRGIAEKVGLSQAHVSRILTKLQKKYMEGKYGGST